MGPIRSLSFVKVFFLTLALWTIAVLIAGSSYDSVHWDGAEIFEPVIRFAHLSWLQGEIPRINWAQSMGETMEINSLASPLYPIYTLATLLALLLTKLGMNASILGVSAALHASIASAGMWGLLTRRLNLSHSTSLAASLGLAFSGALLLYSPIWPFVPAQIAWAPWILYGLSAPPKDRSSVLIAGVGLCAITVAGHQQFTIYAWTFIGLFVLISGVPLIRSIIVFALGILLSAPHWIPTILHLEHASRSAGLSREEFLMHALSKSAYWGAFSSLFRLEHGGLTQETRLSYAGLLPLLGLSALFLSRPARTALKNKITLAVGMCSLLFLLFSVGPNFFLYPLTFNIPFWNLLRWPFKFSVWVPIGLTVVAVVAWDHSQLNKQVRWLGALFTLACLGVAWTQGSAYLKSLSGILLLVLPLVVLAAPRTLTVVSAVGAVAFFVSIQSHEFRDLEGGGFPRIEIQGTRTYGANALPRRYLPLSVDHHHKLSLGAHELATINSEFSAAGTPYAPTPKHVIQNVPVDINAIPTQVFRENLISSFEVRSRLAVSELRVASEDTNLIARLDQMKDFSRCNARDGVVNFCDSRVPEIISGDAIQKLSLSPGGNVLITLDRASTIKVRAWWSRGFEAIDQNGDTLPVNPSPSDPLYFEIEPRADSREVLLRYSPKGFALGGALALTALFGLGVSLFWRWNQRP